MNLGEAHVLDEIDRQLLDELQSDCKRSLKEIGALVGLSAPSVMERVRKLESGGIIKGYHALLDARKVGLDISAFIGVSISDPCGTQRFGERVSTADRHSEPYAAENLSERNRDLGRATRGFTEIFGGSHVRSGGVGSRLAGRPYPCTSAFSIACFTTSARPC